MDAPSDDLFAVDTAADSTWTCEICNVTIRVKDNDSHAIETHKRGKPHLKKLRKAAEAAGEAPPPDSGRSAQRSVS